MYIERERERYGSFRDESQPDRRGSPSRGPRNIAVDSSGDRRKGKESMTIQVNGLLFLSTPPGCQSLVHRIVVTLVLPTAFTPSTKILNKRKQVNGLPLLSRRVTARPSRLPGGAARSAFPQVVPPE